MLWKLLRSAFQANAQQLIARGLTLRQQGDLRAAERVLREAVEKFPRDANAAVNLALMLLEQNQAAAGAAELERALRLDSANGAAHYNLANLLRMSGRIEDAIRHFELATRAQPPIALARQELMFALLDVCDWNTARQHAERLRAQCNERSAGWMRAIAPLTASYLELDTDACKQLAAYHAAEAARGTGASPRQHTARGDRRLRIGYLSQDFRDHPVGQLISAALPLHDRNRFEVFAYSCGYDDDSIYRQRIVDGVEHFTDIAKMSDAAAAAAIAADGVEVLIDLAGHTTGGRLGVLARRPAPVQAHYLGYAATTGAPYIDYFITDTIATPPALADAFTEQLAYVPACFMPSGGAPDSATAVPIRAAQGLPDASMVYACFTNSSRITTEVFALWMEILAAVPDSVLWLKQSHATTVNNLRAEAQRHAIDPSRLVFAQRVPAKADHLARLGLTDLALDTIGWHNGHTTTNDMLWAGVPVLTAPGRTFAARVGASLIQAAGLSELIAQDERDYVDTAVRLGRERALCADLKQKLAVRDAMFFDGRSIVAGLEAVYAEMSRRSRDGLPPAQIRTR